MSATIVTVVALVTAVGWLVSNRDRTSAYSYPGPLKRVGVRLASGRAVIVGSSSSTIEVRRSDDYAFGRAARERRLVDGGVLRVSSGCPRVVVRMSGGLVSGNGAARLRIVPDALSMEALDTLRMGEDFALRRRRRRLVESVAADHLSCSVSVRSMLDSWRASGPRGDRCGSSLGCGGWMPTAFS
jgi:hypothetical protein